MFSHQVNAAAISTIFCWLVYSAIETYVAVTAELGIILKNGSLFRPTNARGHVENKPFSSASAEARLRVYVSLWNVGLGNKMYFNPIFKQCFFLW